jgi:hypothetical protein
VLPDAGHYTFLAPCTLRGRWTLGDACEDPAGADREARHADAAARMAAFFEEALGD